MSVERTDLDTVEDQLIQVESLIAQHAARVADLGRRGVPTQPAETLLALLKDVRAHLEKHRDAIAASLQSPGGPGQRLLDPDPGSN